MEIEITETLIKFLIFLYIVTLLRSWRSDDYDL